MFKKYKFPLNIFMIFEKINPVIYTSDCITPNHYAIVIPKEWYFSFIKAFRNELFFNSSTLIEQSCIDTKNFSKLNDSLHLSFSKKDLILFNLFYFYLTKTRITIMLNINRKESVVSLDSLYENAN